MISSSGSWGVLHMCREVGVILPSFHFVRKQSTATSQLLGRVAARAIAMMHSLSLVRSGGPTNPVGSSPRLSARLRPIMDITHGRSCCGCDGRYGASPRKQTYAVASASFGCQTPAMASLWSVGARRPWMLNRIRS